MVDAKDDTEFHRQMAPLMEAIGHVAHHWARLEFEINRLIWNLSALTPAEGACVTTQIPSIVPRLRALISLAGVNGASKPLIKELNRFSVRADALSRRRARVICVRADALSRRRARVIHDPWFFREYKADTQTYIEYGRLEVTADKRLTLEMKPQSRGDVLGIAHDIIAAHKEFISLRERIHSELKEQLESHLDISLEELLDSQGPDSDT